MQRFLLALLLFLVPSSLTAQTFLVSISNDEVSTLFDGETDVVDLQFDFSFLAEDVLVGQSGGDLYAGLNYTVSSTALSLDGVDATSLLDFELNPTFPLFENLEPEFLNDGFLLNDSVSTAGVGALGFNGVLSSFDSESSLIANGSLTSVVSTVPDGSGSNSGLQSTLSNGSNLSVQSFLSSSTTISITAVPEPSSTLLLVATVGGVLCSRRRRSIASD